MSETPSTLGTSPSQENHVPGTLPNQPEDPLNQPKQAEVPQSQPKQAEAPLNQPKQAEVPQSQPKQAEVPQGESSAPVADDNGVLMCHMCKKRPARGQCKGKKRTLKSCQQCSEANAKRVKQCR